MMRTFTILFLLVVPLLTFSQEKKITIRGTVKEKNTLKPIQGVEVKTIIGSGTETNALGDFRIQAAIGDELIISHDSFHTVRHEITDGQKIEVLVEESREGRKREFERKKRSLSFEKEIKASLQQMKKDAGKSIGHAEKALASIEADDPLGHEKKARLYKILGDVYLYWKQADLAEANYQTSLDNTYRDAVKIKLGEAQLANKQYEKALLTFNSLLSTRIKKEEKVILYEGRGDAYAALNRYKEAEKSYNQALSLSRSKKKLDEKVILLNAKLAEILQKQGELSAAAGYMDQSVELADQKDKKTVAKQRAIAADFYNKRNSFEKEIELRKETLEDIEELEEAEPTNTLEDQSLSPQVQNYKIANALASQKDYDVAIPYLKESIKEAASKNDLVVQKDATRKLGEVYREKGDLKKASEAFKEYEVIIDKLYILKEQEISQAARFSRELTKKANRISTLEKDRELSESKYKLALAAQELSKQRSLRQQIIIYSLIGLTVLLLFMGYLMYRNMKQQRYANNMLALKSLRSQMNPHFIFNALNSVNTFIATNDERAANRYLTDFSLLMRSVLENSEMDFIPLEKEIELLELYTQLEHFRFQDKFDYTIEVDPSIKIGDYQIPPMLLQPYVENAVWHGLRYKHEKGVLQITFKKLDISTIEISIADDGIGRAKSKEIKTQHQKKQQSKGMSNIKQRIQILNKMYKNRVGVAVSDLTVDKGGTLVVLKLKRDI